MTTDNLSFCTIASKNYISYARTLIESIKEYYPKSQCYVLLTDRNEGCIDYNKESFSIIEIEELEIPNVLPFCFQYNILELNTAAKPFFLEFLFKHKKLKNLVYLDPDIMLFNRLSTLEEKLKEFSIILTPHFLSPYNDARSPSEVDIMRSGVFNLGFLALKNSESSFKLLDWWKEKLSRFCIIDLEAGYFVDQRWMDLAPALFEEVCIFKDPSYNVAYWNFHERKITIKNDQVFINNIPCSFIHFSGYSISDPDNVSKHQNRFSMQALGQGAVLFEKYKEKLLKNGFLTTKTWPYAFGFFNNGEKITDLQRKQYWLLQDTGKRFGDPFEIGHGSFFEWIKNSNKGHMLSGRGHNTSWGINVSGYLKEKGTEALKQVLIKSKIPFKWINSSSCFNSYIINLVSIDGNQVESFAKEKRMTYFYKHFNIGFWNWESEELPDNWLPALNYFNEIWVPSNYNKKALEKKTKIPVKRVPYPVVIPNIPSHMDRKYFGLPEQAFIFFYSFDFRSLFERKNPLQSLNAFISAFKDNPRAFFVLHTTHSEADLENFNKIKQYCNKYNNIILIDRLLPSLEWFALMNQCNAYISLHRCESFDFPIYEAMAMGKPVIATNYSSNTDFMHNENSLPVNYTLVEIDKNYEHNQKGMHWAEPDLDHAISQMIKVFNDPILAHKIGEQARKDITEQLNSEKIGELIKNNMADLIINGQTAVGYTANNLYTNNSFVIHLSKWKFFLSKVKQKIKELGFRGTMKKAVKKLVNC